MLENLSKTGTAASFWNRVFSLTTRFNRILIGKFERMMHPNAALIKSGFRVRQVVTIRVISGQNLPKIPQEESDIVDPYVTLKVYGHPQDHFKYKTKSVSNNGSWFLSKWVKFDLNTCSWLTGLNPVWNETATMEVRMPEMDLLLITVKDEDTITSNDFIGWYCLPLTSLAKGYRHIPLLNEEGKNIPMASIFVHVSLRKIDSQKSS